MSTNPKDKLVPVEEVESPETTSSLKAQLKALQDEEAMLDLELKREKVAKIRAERENKLTEMREKTKAILDLINQRKRLQQNCNHRKGGRGAGAVLNGQGMDSMYAIIRHVCPSGRLMILCQRCGQEEYSRDPLTGEAQTSQFDRFSNFPTDNQTSGSSLFIAARG